MIDIQKIIEEIDNLKPIPQVAHKIISIVEDPQSDSTDLAAVILHDPAMTANLLRICNSPYFGLSRKVDSVQQAITYLGMDQIVDMVIMKVGCESFKDEHEGYDLRDGELWRYSVSSALVCRDLAQTKQSKGQHLLFTASLLKDIGKVILHRYVRDVFDEIDKMVREKQTSFREAEKAILGFDHAEIGGMVAEKWQFSTKLVHMIRNHHLPEAWKEDDLDTAIVYLADTVCMMMGIGVGSDGLAYRFHSKVIDALDFSERDLQALIASFGDKLFEVEALIASA